VSILWSNDVRAGSFELLAYFLPFGVIAVGVARAPWSRRALTWLGLELVGLALVFAAVGVYQYATRNLFWNPKVIVGNAYLPFYRVNSVFWDPSIYGRFLMVAIVVALVVVVRGESKRLVLGAAGALAAIWVGLLLSYSQSSFAGLIVAVVALLALVWRRAALLATAFVALVLLSTGIANPNVQNAFLKRSGAALDRATSDRAGLVYNGVRIAVENPLAGVGVGAFRRHYAELTGLRGKEPKKAASHDTPVTVAAENGLVGLGLFAWVLVAAFGLLARTKGGSFMRRSVLAIALALVAITVHSLFYDHFFEDPTTWCLLGLAGLAYGTSPAAAPVTPARSAMPPRSREREARRASPAPAPAAPAV
jgi:O-antigen ligase